MPFDITDAYINLTEIKETQNKVILLLEFIQEKLEAEGIYDKKEFEAWFKKKQKEN